MLYTVQFDTAGQAGLVKTFQTAHTAARFAKWLDSRPWASNVIVWKGLPGGERA